MKTRPMLGDFALDGIEYIESSESRALAEHRVPGLAGNYFQDMGAVANTIVIAGTKSGDEARDDFLNGVRAIFNKGEQTTFVADINTATDITDVIIEDLDVAEVGGSAHSFRYQLKLRKYTKPPEPPQTSLLDMGILGDALNVLDALNALDALSSLPNLGDPTGPVRGALDSLKGTTSGLDQAVGSIRGLLSQDVPAPGTSGGPGATPATDGAPGTTSESGAAPAPQEGSTQTPGAGDSGTTPSPTAPNEAGMPAGEAGDGGPGSAAPAGEAVDTAPAPSEPAIPGSNVFALDDGPPTETAAQPATDSEPTAPAADAQPAEPEKTCSQQGVDVGFVHFNNDRHVLMPEGPTPEPNSDPPGGGADGLEIIARALEHAKLHPFRWMFVAGHSDSTALIQYNLPLSLRRANSAFFVLRGYKHKEDWVKNALVDNGHADDWRRILRWVHKQFNFDCEASDPLAPNAAKDNKAITGFQKDYNKEVDRLASAGTNEFAPGFTEKIPASQLGFVGLSTWRAFFDCYQRDLMRQLNAGTQADLTARQEAVIVVLPDRVGCSEFHSRNLAEREARHAEGFKEKPGPSEPKDRRAEIIFFDPEETPPLDCHPTPDKCEPSKCILYKDRLFIPRPLPALGAASSTTIKLEAVEVKRRGAEDFAEGRNFSPLLGETIRFRVSLTGLSLPFEGTVRVTVSRNTSVGPSQVAIVKQEFCSDADADVEVEVTWDGKADRKVPRRLSTRTTPDHNANQAPTPIPLRELDKGDHLRHGVYFVEQIELLEKDDAVVTTAKPTADPGFVVPVVVTIFFNMREFTSSMQHFGFGDGTRITPPYGDELRSAINKVITSYYNGIGVRFASTRDQTKSVGIEVEIEDTLSQIDTFPGGTSIEESGLLFLINANIFGWCEKSFGSLLAANQEHFRCSIGPTSMLGRNADQESDDSKALHEMFGPVGVERDSIFDQQRTPKATRPRTVTNGKVEGSVTTADVAATTVTVSDTGQITVASSNPTAVPTQRATDIQRALNALANSIGTITAHEIGHCLGLVSKRNSDKTLIEVSGTDVLGALAGDDGHHNRNPVGHLMDPGDTMRFRRIFKPGERLPFRDSNKRYLKDVFPDSP